MAKTKNKTSKKNKSKKKTQAAATDAPQMFPSKVGLTASAFLKEVNSRMDNPLSLKDLRDLQVCVESVAQDEISEGHFVNLFGLVRIIPRYHSKGTRMVNEEFGNPDSKKVKKTYKAKISLVATQGIFSKRVKDAMPSVQKLAKVVGK